MTFKVPNDYRIVTGPLASSARDGNNGAFMINARQLKKPLFCIASDGMGWEHVSVSIKNLCCCPTWHEMNFVKNLFWDETDIVVQFHPPKTDYINNHPFCLHLWRPTNQELPRPEWF